MKRIPCWRTMLAPALAPGLLTAGSETADAALIDDLMHGRYLSPNTTTSFFDAGNQTIANSAFFDFAAATVIAFTKTEITSRKTRWKRSGDAP